MNKVWCVVVCFFNLQYSFAQQLPVFSDTLFSTYYHQRVSHFNTLPASREDIVFLGNSITDGAEWVELFNDVHIKNRGISGDMTTGVMHRLSNIVSGKPIKIFLLIGINDLARGVSADSVFRNIATIVSYVHHHAAATQVYVQSILPVNDYFKKFTGHTNKSEQIKELNTLLRNRQKELKYTFIDLFPHFCNDAGKLDTAYTNDGLHLKGNAYMLWKHVLFPYLYNVETKPSLIPYPKKIEWNNTLFPLWKTGTVYISDTGIAKMNLQYFLGRPIDSLFNAVSTPLNKPIIKITLSKERAPALNDEAYSIHIDSLQAELKANSLKGIFYALQTFKQLRRDGAVVDGCDIQDWPSFSWRAYMVDAGRNYESINLLKQQIDRMSAYKLNVFHFHCTEDIAWRWQVKCYPQLTNAGYMLRDKGMYYSIDELKELIAYCKERYIEFVPELDMPGHSKAFERAMGCSMQSEKGKKILYDILDEISATYQLKYFHIGGDEVKITDTAFLPAMEKRMNNNHITTIGWKPGGNFRDGTIMQLWMGNEQPTTSKKYIDSRHFYINHFDPFESVVTIFNRKVGGVNTQTQNVLGAELCLWNDRRVANEEDILKLNPVYPSMLAFAEKVWNGNGSNQYVSGLSELTPQGQENFMLFERKLLEHKKLYFHNSSFPYSEQASSYWHLAGPFFNKGNLTMRFTPETKNFDSTYNKPDLIARGNTIILKHWWYPMISGILAKPEENTTWYALRKIWSDDNGLQPFWIGFNNMSRSTATDSPDALTWDDKHSCIWVNGKLILPPQWQHASLKGDLEVPLIDEGYEYREPLLIPLKKGWDEIVVKLPVGSFKGKDWQNPVKWMFTVAPVDPENK